MRTLIIGGSNSVDLARSVARRAKTSFCALSVERFPDKETLIRIPADVTGRHAVIVNATLPDPNCALMEMTLAIDAARRAGAKRVTIIAPYLSYMRQDKVFEPGQAISAQVMAHVLENADTVIAVDPHLHRIHRLRDIFQTKAASITANPLLADFISRRYPDAVVLGPDGESYQWAQAIARRIGHDSTVLEKTRYGAKKVSVRTRGNVSLNGRDVVIVDDMISTGHTVAEAAKLAKRLGARHVSCVCVHGLFLGDAVAVMRKAGVRDITSTNTVHTRYSKIDIAPLIADALR